MNPLKHAFLSLVVFVSTLCILPTGAAAEQRFIVRTDDVITSFTGPVTGLQALSSACRLLGCTVRYGLDDVPNRLFLVTAPDAINPQIFLGILPLLWGIQQIEPDLLLRTVGGETQDAPPALMDAEPLSFYGSTVRGGYLRQPADQILGISAARDQYGLTGRGVTVAVIDTGVDPAHPVLRDVLLQGYDFTRNRDGGSEAGDVNDSMMYTVDQAMPAYVNESTIAVLDESTIAILDDSRYRAFGHGTMVAGLVHLVAPQASIVPLKAFGPDGTGYTSDVLRAINFAVTCRRQGAEYELQFRRAIA